MFLNKRNKKGMCLVDLSILLTIIFFLIIEAFCLYPKVRVSSISDNIESIYKDDKPKHPIKDLSFKKILNQKNEIIGTAFSYKDNRYTCENLSIRIISKFPNKLGYLHIEKNNIDINNKETIKSQIKKSCNRNNKDYVSSINFLLKN